MKRHVLIALLVMSVAIAGCDKKKQETPKTEADKTQPDKKKEGAVADKKEGTVKKSPEKKEPEKKVEAKPEGEVKTEAAAGVAAAGLTDEEKKIAADLTGKVKNKRFPYQEIKKKEHAKIFLHLASTSTNNDVWGYCRGTGRDETDLHLLGQDQGKDAYQ